MYTIQIRKGYEWDACVKLSQMDVMFKFTKSSWDSSYTFYMNQDPRELRELLGYMCVNKG